MTALELRSYELQKKWAAKTRERDLVARALEVGLSLATRATETTGQAVAFAEDSEKWNRRLTKVLVALSSVALFHLAVDLVTR